MTSEQKDQAHTLNLIYRFDVTMPNFMKMCQEAASKGIDTVILHQDAFASHETRLLGGAIRYAGLCGLDVCVVAGDEYRKGHIASNPDRYLRAPGEGQT